MVRKPDIDVSTVKPQKIDFSRGWVINCQKKQLLVKAFIPLIFAAYTYSQLTGMSIKTL